MCRSYPRVLTWFLAAVLPAALGCRSETSPELTSPECDEVDDPGEPTQLALIVQNQRSAPVYLASPFGCAESNRVVLSDAQGQTVQQGRRCQAQLEAASCQPAVGVKIPPGGQYTLAVEAATYAEPSCRLAADTCQRRVPLATGIYQLSVGWYTSMYGGADCVAAEGTTCTVPFVAGGGERQVATLPWDYPAEGTLTLLIQ
jgi:hypothetical protein